MDISVASHLNSMSSGVDSSQVQSTDPWTTLPTCVGPPLSLSPFSQASAHSPISLNATLGPLGAAQPASCPITTPD